MLVGDLPVISIFTCEQLLMMNNERPKFEKHLGDVSGMSVPQLLLKLPSHALEQRCSC